MTIDDLFTWPSPGQSAVLDRNSDQNLCHWAMLTWCALVNAKTAMICCPRKPRPAPPMQVHSWLDGIVSIVLLIFESLLLCVYSLVSSETFRSDARIRRTRKKKRKFGHQSRSYLQNPVNVLYSRQAQQWFMTFLGFRLDSCFCSFYCTAKAEDLACINLTIDAIDALRIMAQARLLQHLAPLVNWVTTHIYTSWLAAFPPHWLLCGVRGR
jgi:hypothetical protein